MLTRHFYRFDEVQSALIISIKKRRYLQVAFWTQELIDSELYDELFQTLYIAWIYFVGIESLEWYRSYIEITQGPEEITDDILVGLAVSLAGKPRDASVFILLAYGSKDKYAGKLKPITGFKKACEKGKPREAWSAAQLLVTKIWPVLKSLSSLDLLEHLEKDECFPVASRCIATLIVSLKTKEGDIDLTIPPLIEKERTEWKMNEGRRARRVYAIPIDCLYWVTARGRISNRVTTLKQVYCDKYTYLRGCPFWDRALETLGTDDTSIELFVDTYFPDDKPEEWSLEDQKKSHGLGMLINDETPTLQKFLSNLFFTIDSSAFPSSINEAIKIFESKTIMTKWTDGFDLN